MIAFAFLLVCAVGCIQAAPSDSANLGSGVSKFTLDLYEKCIESSDGNVILSPFSVAIAVALAGEGARGTTFDQIKNGLHLSGDKNAIAQQFHEITTSLAAKSSQKSVLKIANKIYAQEGRSIKKEFRDIAVDKFNSEVQSLNFAQSASSAATINTWVAQQTNDKIQNLISSDALDSDTRMVLVNAIYFKGSWEHKFNKDLTKPAPFWVTEERSVDVDFMHLRQDLRVGFFEKLDATVLELKYEGSEFAMLILLPNSRTGIANLEEKLKNEDLARISEQLHKREVVVTLPKFKAEYSVKLKPVLESLGLTQLFSDVADFSDLLDSNESLKVSEVIHKAFISVDEEGAEAAAATAVMVAMSQSFVIKPEPIRFVADHPFVYAITASQNTLFIGNLKSPKI